MDVAKKVQLEKHIEQEKHKLEEIRHNPEYGEGILEEIRKRIAKLNDDLSVRQESIDPLKGRLKDQITSFKEMIARVLDKDILLAGMIRILFRATNYNHILMAIGMAIGVLVEALLPGGEGGEGGAAGSAVCKPLPKEEEGLKEWIRNKLKAFSSLLGRLRVKALEALCGIFLGAVLDVNPSCTKVFGTHTLYEGGGGVELTASLPIISKMADYTNFNFDRPLGLSMRGKRPIELMI